MTPADHDRLNNVICELREFANIIVENDTHKCIIKIRDGNIQYQLLSFADDIWNEANFRPRYDDII